MIQFLRPAVSVGALAALTLGVVACGGSVASSPNVAVPAVPSASTRSTAASARSNVPFSYAVHPRLNALSPDIILSNCSSSNKTYLQCATPTTLKTGYNFPPNGGAGQTIAIVDPFGSPTIENDLAQFSSLFGLPALIPSEGASCPTPSTSPSFTIYYPGGKPTFNSSNSAQVNFAEETSLDVEWAHAAAPQANILLVVPANDQGQTVQSAQAAAIACAGVSVLSLSFGTPESSINGGANNSQLQQAEANYQTARSKNITVIASVGDLGATGGSGTLPNPEYPASSPNVLAVGGTNLVLKKNTSSYNNESVWNDTNNCLSPCSDASAPGATGGAPSSIFVADPLGYPNAAKAWAAYQLANNLSGSFPRWTNDVAYNASPNTGVVVYISFLQQAGLASGTLFAIGGTSQGPPQWAGIIATANALRPSNLGFVNEKLYGLSATTSSFHDVTSGNNAFAGAPGYAALTGWDPPTGLGSADVGNLVTALAAAP